MLRKTKNIVILLISVCLLLGLTACGKNENIAQQTKPDTPKAQQQTEAVAEPEDTEKDVLVAYFSATGNTKSVAEKIAQMTNADLYEIIPAEPYTSEDLNYNNEQSRTTLEMNDLNARPEIGSETISLETYSTIYLGYPIWHGQAPRIMDTFVESYNFDDITIIPFCTSGGSDIGNSGEQLEEKAGSGAWLPGRRFDSDITISELQTWLDEIQ